MAHVADLSELSSDQASCLFNLNLVLCRTRSWTWSNLAAWRMHGIIQVRQDLVKSGKRARLDKRPVTVLIVVMADTTVLIALLTRTAQLRSRRCQVWRGWLHALALQDTHLAACCHMKAWQEMHAHYTWVCWENVHGVWGIIGNPVPSQACSMSCPEVWCILHFNCPKEFSRLIRLILKWHQIQLHVENRCQSRPFIWSIGMNGRWILDHARPIVRHHSWFKTAGNTILSCVDSINVWSVLHILSSHCRRHHHLPQFSQRCQRESLSINRCNVAVSPVTEGSCSMNWTNQPQFSQSLTRVEVKTILDRDLFLFQQTTAWVCLSD